VIEYLAYQELSRIDEGLTLRTVTVVPPLTVLLFAGPIRSTKETIENFELAEEDISADLLAEEEAEEKRRDLMQQLGIPQPTDNSWNGHFANGHKFNEYDERPEYIMELESWLAFKGPFESMQCLARLRFKLMSYFLDMLKTPFNGYKEPKRQDDHLLECLNQVLEADHKKHYFNECKDLPKAKPRTYQSYNQTNLIAPNDSNYHRSNYNNMASTQQYNSSSNNHHSYQPLEPIRSGGSSSGWSNGNHISHSGNNSSSNGHSRFSDRGADRDNTYGYAQQQQPRKSFGRYEYHNSNRYGNSRTSSSGGGGGANNNY
jgi:hypothetical protein